MHLLNTRICRYTYLTPTVIYCDQDRYVMDLFKLESGLMQLCIKVSSDQITFLIMMLIFFRLSGTKIPFDLFLSPRTTKLWRGYRVCPVRMYVSTYVRTYVRSFVCSPALATSFIIQFRYNFTQVLDMTIPRTSSRFSVIGSRSRSQ